MKRTIRVVDVHPTTTAEEAEQSLNAVCDEGYYVLSIVPCDDGTRAFFGKRREPNKPNVDGKREEALEIIKAHPNESVREIVARLQDAGIKRGRSWVSEQRFALINQNGR